MMLQSPSLEQVAPRLGTWGGEGKDRTRIRTLLFSTLYPSEVRPGHGVFVETRLRELLRSGAIETRVMAPVPWFPSTHSRFGEYALMARTPRREIRGGVEVVHPRYPLLPKVGMTVAPFLLAAACLGPARRLQSEGFDFDLIDAHYFYPDGVAAALLAGWLGKPLAITARGTDLNLIARYKLPRLMMQWAARRAQASIGVCGALVDVLRDWNVDGSRLHVMRNGVDLDRFRPLDRAASRSELGWPDGPVLLSVGHLIERKGHHLVIEALARVRARWPDARLVIVGEGPERKRLLEQIQRLGLADSCQLVGAVAQQRLITYYSAADLLVLASSREGWANVLLESMACGTAVVATRIWGTPEVVTSDAVGRLVERRESSQLAGAVGDLLLRPPSRSVVRAYAEGFGWEETSRAQLELFTRMVQPGLEPSRA